MMLRVKKRKIFLIAFMLFFPFFLYSVDFSFLEGKREIILDGNNYLEMKGPRSVLVDLPGCMIPLEIETAESHASDFEVCDTNRPRFTYVKGNKLILNSTFKGVSCCYKGISKDPFADEAVVSNDCKKMRGSEVVVDEDAILVICDYANKIYDDYYAIARQKSKLVENNDVPNIVMIGLDSVSRFHFHQLMPKTRQILEQLGSVELLGYTKVGENTFPNVIALLTGYEEDQVLKFCYNRSKPIDSCPFIWNDLKMDTAFIEDAPKLAIFNYYKFGFLKQPTTHYLRPLMLAASNDYHPYKLMFPCVGSHSTESFVLDHIEQLLQLKTPLFSFTWLTSLAHENVDNLPAADILFSNFFKKLNVSNTVLIFMSDHGLRFGKTRTTFNGWYNEKLPYFTITIPPKVKSFLGSERIETLKSNVKRLTTPFEVYHTLMDILKAYKVKEEENTTAIALKNNKNSIIPRTLGQSLFTSISPKRTCKEAGVPKDYCACADLQAMDLRDPIVEQTVRIAMEKINSWIPRRCRQLSLDQITAAAKVNDQEYILGFTVRPGGFQFETTGRFDGKHGKMQIKRVNHITGVWCINDWFIEFYCYCDLLGIILEYVSGN